MSGSSFSTRAAFVLDAPAPVAVLAADEDEIAVADVRVDHAVAPDAQREDIVAPVRQRLG